VDNFSLKIVDNQLLYLYMQNQKAFTLLEIILVVAAIVILAGIVIIAINPAKQMADFRDSQRTVDIGEINKALTLYQIDHKGIFPVTFPTDLIEICDTWDKTFDEVLASDCDGYLNLSFLVPTYLVAIPRDPSLTSSYLPIIENAYAALGGTKYKVFIRNNRFVFWAEDSETKTVLLNIEESELARLVDESEDGEGGEDEDEDEEEVADGLVDTLSYNGNDYPIVKIGDQYWFARNLNTAYYRNGDEILHVHGNPHWYEWDNLVGKWSYLNNGNGDNNLYFGRLYNWYAISDARGLCPSGWHIPTITDWNTLEAYVGEEAGKKLKASSADNPSWDGTNAFYFSALPGGIRWIGGSFSSWGTTYFWSSDVSGEVIPTRQLSSWNDSFIHLTNQKSEGLSVRCIKD